MIYINQKTKFRINNPYALFMIVKALLEIECALTLEDSAETEFESVNRIKDSLRDEIDTDDPAIIGLFGEVLNKLGANIKTVKQVRGEMKKVIRLMENPKEKDLIYLKKFCLHLGRDFHDFRTKYRMR